MNTFKFPADRTFVIAEVGINHNGSVEIARKLIDAAADAGCDAVKFQKRTPELSLPRYLWDVERDTPWNSRMTYLDYRRAIELGPKEYGQIDAHCHERGVLWFASPWDKPSVDDLVDFGAPLLKIASASVTDLGLVEHIASKRLPVIMSTGMCSLADVNAAVEVLRGKAPQLGLLVCTSNYPAAVEDLNLSRIHTLQEAFPEAVVGYSGHEAGLWTTLCAVAMGARIVERHITLDRSMPGTDQAASVEPQGFAKLVREIRNLERARGHAVIQPLKCEAATIKRLRG